MGKTSALTITDFAAFHFTGIVLFEDLPLLTSNFSYNVEINKRAFFKSFLNQFLKIKPH